MSQYPGDLEENEANHHNNGDPCQNIGEDQPVSQPATGAIGRELRRDVRMFSDHRWLRSGTPARRVRAIVREGVNFL